MSSESILNFEFHSFVPDATSCLNIKDVDTKPTAKVFGRTNLFISVCVNITNLYPYFYVRITSAANFTCVNDSYFVKVFESTGVAESMYFTTSVSKIPFYNYHDGSQSFLKVSCCNEPVRKRMVDGLKKFKSDTVRIYLYEAHISFSLQFMSDYGVVGMGRLICQNAKIEPTPRSTCNIEYTISALDILNNRIASEHVGNALMPALSQFLSALNLGEGEHASPLFESINLNDPISLSSCSYTHLPTPQIPYSQPAKRPVLVPSVQLYRYTLHPPLASQFDGISTFDDDICHKSSTCSSWTTSTKPQFYVPSVDPPQFNRSSRASPSMALKEVCEKLTLVSDSSTPFSLFDINGEHFLKFLFLEIYCSRLDGQIHTLYFCTEETHYLWSISYDLSRAAKVRGLRTQHFSHEFAMIEFFIEWIRNIDPDILVGFDADSSSWGQLGQRYQKLNRGLVLSSAISRLSLRGHANGAGSETGKWLSRAGSSFQVPGRIIFNLWRIFQDEVSLRLYNLGSIYKHYFSHTIPAISAESMEELLKTDKHSYVKYLERCMTAIIDLTLKTPFLIKAVEFSRLFGTDLYSTLTRGSQYRVESVMIRAIHMENYVAHTPFEQDVYNMRAAQGLPLCMEPRSGIYLDPVVVLDFQSLYPSMIIAYNLCYATLLGKFDGNQITTSGFKHHPSSSEFNMPDLEEADVYSAPFNIKFVSRRIRHGVLPRLLQEILSARIAIKNAMKVCEKKLYSVLDARQLALKYISNVTYGYTSGFFSGRMPNVDVADAIVQNGRSTLERAIGIIESNLNWNAKVVYGDTDSLFIALPGRTKAEAFDLGKAMASLITSINPPPVVLKFEKVYQPCVLMSKKRYCGYKYENPGSLPAFDAKGIETVRRDGCLLTAKILEKSLRLIFTGHDLNDVKLYVQRQMVKILSYEKLNVSDFVFAREVRFGSYKYLENNRLPLSAVAAKQILDRNPEIQIPYGQRIPFVIVYRPFCKLHQCVVDLEWFIQNQQNYKVDVIYYITKQIIPVLKRALLIDGVDVLHWYHSLPVTKLKFSSLPRYHMFSDRGRPHIEIKSFQSFRVHALYLQHLQSTERANEVAHGHFCGNIECTGPHCPYFWECFNFNHIHGSTITALESIFEL